MTSIKAIKWSNPTRSPTVGASATLPVQLPFIGKHFPDILGAYPATINLLLEQPLLVQGYDFRTPPINWQYDGSAPEEFDFVRVELEIRGNTNSVWLYFAHGSPHRQNPAIHEIIARSKLTIRDNEQCILRIPRTCTSIPNGNRPVIVIM